MSVALGIGALVATAALLVILMQAAVVHEMRAALERARVRMVIARRAIYTNWSDVDTMLGVGERDIARVLQYDRDDVKPNGEAVPLAHLEQMIAAHRTQTSSERLA